MCGNKTWNPINMYKSYTYVFEKRVKSILEVTNCSSGDVSVVVSDRFQSRAYEIKFLGYTSRT